jgi:hypothetical protein
VSVDTTPAPMHDANEYNWNGFSCPYCGASSFVSCGGGHLACDGAVELRNGRKFHQCFCGHAGFISGTIKSLASNRLSVEAERGLPSLPEAKRQQPNSKPPDVALPPPRSAARPSTACKVASGAGSSPASPARRSPARRSMPPTGAPPGVATGLWRRGRLDLAAAPWPASATMMGGFKRCSNRSACSNADERRLSALSKKGRDRPERPI